MRSGALAIAAALALACAFTWVVFRLAGSSLAEEPQMRIGLVAVPGQEPLAVASTRGALDPSRVLVVELFSLQDLHNAFLDGNVHAGVFSLDEALRLTGSPIGARIERFLGVSRSPLVLLAAPDVANLSDLRGRSIGLEAGRRAMGALREILARGGLTLGDVELHLLDAASAPLVLAQKQVAAALVYPPASMRSDFAAARVLARWEAPSAGELMVLVANSRAHRLAAGQLEHVALAWDAGVQALRSPDAAATALIARREEIAASDVATQLAAEQFFDSLDDRRLREPDGRPVVEAALSTIAARWRALGVPDSVPAIESWLVPPRKPS